MVSYLTSNTLRYANRNYHNTGSQQVSNFTDGSECFATYTSPKYHVGDPAPCNKYVSQGRFSSPYGGFDGQDPCTDGELSVTSPACKAGASMLLTYLGNMADINAVVPKITQASLSDQWRPDDRWVVNAAVRFENDTYGLADTNNPATNFWFAAAQKEFCVNPVTRQPIFVPQPPQSIYFFTPFVSFKCPVDKSTGTPVQTVHPNGTDGILLTNNYPSSYSVAYVLPRVSATYTVNPDTVLRVSAGRYAQQPQNYEIQYNTAQPNLASTLLGFIPFGYSSPLHEAQPQYSNNYDFSYEHHFKGTDVAMKLTPFYRYATGQLYETPNLPSLGVSPSFNAGTQRVDGVELLVTKGDFTRNGFSGTFSYTYTNSAEKWNNYLNSNVGPVDQYNQDIQEFNALTKAGGGAPCYKANGKGKRRTQLSRRLDPQSLLQYVAGGAAWLPRLVRTGAGLPVHLSQHVRGRSELPAQQVRGHAGIRVARRHDVRNAGRRPRPRPAQLLRKSGKHRHQGRQPAHRRLYVLRQSIDQRRHQSGLPLHPQSSDRDVRYVRPVPSALAVQFGRSGLV